MAYSRQTYFKSNFNSYPASPEAGLILYRNASRISAFLKTEKIF
jgi:hypothetical protein